MGKIVLGTAQFGMDYGINNSRGKIPSQEVVEILDYALESGVDILDTAYDYGASEKIIGDYVRASNKKIKVISKLPKFLPLQINDIVKGSLNELGIESFYGYLIHDFSHYKADPGCWAALEGLKAKGIIKKIGFSLYYPSELEMIIENNIQIDLIRVPYNILDRRFADYFPILKEMVVEVHARSVFLQGLLFRERELLGDYFSLVKTKLYNLQTFAKKVGIPLAAILVNYVILNEYVDKVVVGVDSLQNMKEIIGAKEYLNSTREIISQLSEFKEYDENILLPFKWEEMIVK